MMSWMYCINVGDRKRMLQMGHVVYHKESTRIVSKVYKTHAAALAAWTRMGKASGKLKTDEMHPDYVYAVAELDYYAKHVEKTVERVNLMNGVTFRESVNTPLHCSPSSESFWSM